MTAKKRRIPIVAAVLVLLAIAACGPSGGDETAIGRGADAEAPQRSWFAAHDATQGAAAERISRVNASIMSALVSVHPDIIKELSR
jgi:hypothetical protein